MGILQKGYLQKLLGTTICTAYWVLKQNGMLCFSFGFNDCSNNFCRRCIFCFEFVGGDWCELKGGTIAPRRLY